MVKGKPVAFTSKDVCGSRLMVVHYDHIMEKHPQPPIAIALHGGSGTILRANLSADKEQAYRKALSDALDIAWRILESGGSSLDAVESGARFLEDCPLFNAGKGAVLTADGGHELDAAIMCGKTREAGAVTGLKTVRNPVSLARRVMSDSPFVLLSGSGAEAFADDAGVDRVEPAWFTTEERLAQLREARERESLSMDHDLPGETKFGTIGVVALDRKGNLAAATSTGGLTNKRYGRVGDSPLIGSGTYADNKTCAVSCTGYGEEFIRAVTAHDVAARIRYLGESLETAARRVMMESLPRINGNGGLVAVDRRGNVSLPFNTDGMYRAWRTSRGNSGVAIFRDE
jgi:beta-aspartyl-peptidase (threonine type)